MIISQDACDDEIQNNTREERAYCQPSIVGNKRHEAIREGKSDSSCVGR